MRTSGVIHNFPERPQEQGRQWGVKEGVRDVVVLPAELVEPRRGLQCQGLLRALTRRCAAECQLPGAVEKCAERRHDWQRCDLALQAIRRSAAGTRLPGLCR